MSDVLSPAGSTVIGFLGVLDPEKTDEDEFLPIRVYLYYGGALYLGACREKSAFHAWFFQMMSWAAVHV